MAAKIRKGDRVMVLAGRDKGKTGEVASVMPQQNRAVVQGVNMVRRHMKQTAQNDAGIFTHAAPIHLSNLALIDPGSNKPTRVGFEIRDGKKVRVSKRSGDVLDG